METNRFLRFTESIKILRSIAEESSSDRYANHNFVAGDLANPRKFHSCARLPTKHGHKIIAVGGEETNFETIDVFDDVKGIKKDATDFDPIDITLNSRVLEVYKDDQP